MVPREAWIAVYMMADHYRGTLYIGVTGHFVTRITTIGKAGAQVSRSVTD